MRLLGLLLFTSLIFPLPDDFQGKVVSIADGDTVTVLRGREQVKVRLNGIDAPEKNQSFGTKSKDALAALAFGKTVTVRSSGTDRYGRTLGVIVADGVNVNEQLVANGWAWHYKQYSTDAKLAQLEASAKAGGKGLWADPNPLPPWEFRSRQRSGTPPPATSASRSSAGSTEDSGYWLNTSSNVRHNSRCQHYKNTSKGRACGPSDGRACGICGG
jgi:micrococcal nuclease